MYVLIYISALKSIYLHYHSKVSCSPRLILFDEKSKNKTVVVFNFNIIQNLIYSCDSKADFQHFILT